MNFVHPKHRSSKTEMKILLPASNWHRNSKWQIHKSLRQGFSPGRRKFRERLVAQSSNLAPDRHQQLRLILKRRGWRSVAFLLGNVCVQVSRLLDEVIEVTNEADDDILQPVSAGLWPVFMATRSASSRWPTASSIASSFFHIALSRMMGWPASGANGAAVAGAEAETGAGVDSATSERLLWRRSACWPEPCREVNRERTPN